MKHFNKWLVAIAAATAGTMPAAGAAMDGSLDPPSVVEQWSAVTTSPRVFDLNFSDTSWPDTWGDSGTGIQCPEFSTGRYVNAVINVPVNGEGSTVTYPVVFHNCIFANKESNAGLAGATAAFARQYYEGQKATNYNNWSVAGHTTYLEDNIKYDAAGKPVGGEAGFVQMCRNAAVDGRSVHGWMEIDHIPYIDRIQWSWSSTSWGRGIKCDIKIGDGEWQPLVWMGSEKQKQGWTLFSDQGYMMENVIDAHDVSLRWRVWDGDGATGASDQVQTAPHDWQAIDPMAQRQAPRVHKVRIYGDVITAEQAQYAADNRVSDPGELSDLSKFGYGLEEDVPAPDADAEVTLLYVNPDGSGDHTTIQAAIDAVPEGNRGIIYIAPGVYDENIYAGTKESHNKFISLIGADAATTILTSGVDRGSDNGKSYLDCAALNVFTPRFYAENLTIRNTSGNVGQAEALYTAADAHLFKGCIISGFQDTYKANGGGRGYFTGCSISGGTDFIYDGGLEWFDDCDIICLPGGQYITAPAEASLSMTKVMYPELSADRFYAGLFFNRCRVSAADGVSPASYYLGRPWKETGGAMFLNSTLGSHIRPEGWQAWNGNESTASFYEYRNINPDGTAVDVSRRASFSARATEGEVEAYMNPEFLFSKFSTTPFDYKTILKGAAAPGNFTISSDYLTWESDDNAAGYIVYRDGVMVALTTEPTYAFDHNGDSSATYSVSAISRHGVTTPRVNATDATMTLAFPSAEGFGKFATGGRGGKVVKVTSVADDGSAGTLRWAFNQYKGEPITIVFDVCGEIALTSELRVNRANWTLAGQSAPGQGIVITRNKVNLGGSQNFIVRNIRFRIGRNDIAGNILTENACGAENCANFIFDHCTFGWSVEENMNTADSHFLTVQYSIVHEGLYNAGHSKGARGYGCQWGGSPATYHHNLLAHNNSRSCRFNGARGEDFLVFMEYVNNVNYNYGKNNCYGGENTADVAEYNGLNSSHECNFINNYYKPGPNSSKTDVTFVTSSYARDGAKSWAPSKWYVSGNIAEGFDAITADNWKGMKAEGYKLDDIRVDSRITPALPYYKYAITGNLGTYIPERYMLDGFESASDGYATVLDHAGTVNRDAVEQRVVADVRGGTATYGGAALGNGMIDTEDDAEGFIAYPSASAQADTDGDGMPDRWETDNGLNPAVADNNMVNSEGYTALEVYLNSLMGETSLTDWHSGITAVVNVAGATFDRASRTITVDDCARGAMMHVFTADGRLVAATTVTSTGISTASWPRALLLVKIQSPAIAPVILKINN